MYYYFRLMLPLWEARNITILAHRGAQRDFGGSTVNCPRAHGEGQSWVLYRFLDCGAQAVIIFFSVLLELSPDFPRSLPHLLKSLAGPY